MQCIARWSLILALLLGLWAFAPSCGSGMGFALVLGDEIFDDSDIGILLYDGLRRGEYVFFEGRWYYHGLGTPYYYNYYNPYGYWP